eukprot:5102665-Amphidinium_carterae.1
MTLPRHMLPHKHMLCRGDPAKGRSLLHYGISSMRNSLAPNSAPYKATVVAHVCRVPSFRLCSKRTAGQDIPTIYTMYNSGFGAGRVAIAQPPKPERTVSTLPSSEVAVTLNACLFSSLIVICECMACIACAEGSQALDKKEMAKEVEHKLPLEARGQI